MKRRYIDLIEIVFAAIALGITTITLVLIGNWGLKLTVSNSTLGVIIGWAMVFGSLGFLIILLINYFSFYKLIERTIQKVILKFFNYEF
jgi:hypothetical protein